MQLFAILACFLVRASARAILSPVQVQVDFGADVDIFVHRTQGVRAEDNPNFGGSVLVCIDVDILQLDICSYGDAGLININWGFLFAS